MSGKPWICFTQQSVGPVLWHYSASAEDDDSTLCQRKHPGGYVRQAERPPASRCFECERIMLERELGALHLPNGWIVERKVEHDGTRQLLDAEGDDVCRLPASIPPEAYADVAALIERLIDLAFDNGKARGREWLQHQFRVLMGAASDDS